MSATVSAQDVKALRERTGAGMMECKAALVEADGDIERAVELIRVKLGSKASKRGTREAGEGAVASYIHANKKVGVLVEIDCETDFVARNEDFLAFAADVALHIAAATPLAVGEDDIPADAREREQRVIEEQAAEQAAGKPDQVRQKMVEGRMRKWLEEVVLLKQVHVHPKYEGKTIDELRVAMSAKTGENVVIRRFTRFAVGE